MNDCTNDLLAAVASAPAARRVAALKLLRGEPQSSGPLLMRMGSAAQYMGLSRGTFARLMEKNRIQRIEIYPGSFRIRRADLDAIVWPDRKGGAS